MTFVANGFFSNEKRPKKMKFKSNLDSVLKMS